MRRMERAASKTAAGLKWRMAMAWSMKVAKLSTEESLTLNSGTLSVGAGGTRNGGRRRLRLNRKWL